jgi:hypothetical protein
MVLYKNTENGPSHTSILQMVTERLKKTGSSARAHTHTHTHIRHMRLNMDANLAHPFLSDAKFLSG